MVDNPKIEEVDEPEDMGIGFGNMENEMKSYGIKPWEDDAFEQMAEIREEINESMNSDFAPDAGLSHIKSEMNSFGIKAWDDEDGVEKRFIWSGKGVGQDEFVK
ncbi:hypothetical protein G7Y89_g13238 [Cudoniella acicularis]|uniref:Uncharacterized protein n=1 Tax=Cudoniella acicularis TaxID=354080 RepID=A0A8H4R8X9_9HELO|nr:hypothetical protein G7Y89_g13238 [Cudoniella acicularis]